MIKSFFFIPGNHPKIFEKAETIKSNEIIIDLEDAVNANDIKKSLDNISLLKKRKYYFFRPNIFNNGIFNKTILLSLMKLGVKKFIIPKFKTIKDLKKIEKLIEKKDKKKFQFILLIENPNSLFSLKEILKKTKLNIYGIAFGSHDYCAEINMEHKLDLLHYPRFTIVSLAKMFNLVSIDIASMEIDNTTAFKKEVDSANAYGFNGKFIIHPKQLSLLKNSNQKRINEAIEIIKIYNQKNKPTIFKYKGRVIEPPHIKQYSNLINNSKHDESK